MITAFQKKKKLNPMLLNVIIISILLHVVGGFVAGVITIATHVIKESAQFEEPPAIVEEEPPPEVKVEIKPKTQPKDQPLQQLKMRQIGNISISNVSVDLPSMGDSFTVSAGIGNLGGNLLGSTRGSLGLGMSDINVFGLTTKAERVLFVVDASRTMLTDEKGGLHSYRVIKSEITDMVGTLSAGTLFNVILIDGHRYLKFKPKLVAAGSQVHSELEKWIAPINSNVNKLGLSGISGTQIPQLTAMPEHEIQGYLQSRRGRGNYNGCLTQFFIEQNADAIFLIRGNYNGFERLRGAPATQKQQQAAQKRANTPEFQAKLAQHKKEFPVMKNRVEKELARINAQRKKQGLPPRVLAHGNQITDKNVYGAAKELGLEWKTPLPKGGQAGDQMVEINEVKKYFKQLLDQLYYQHSRTPPSLNIVLFLAGDGKLNEQQEAEFKEFVRFFNGKKRVLRGLDGIKQASTSSAPNS